VTRSEGLDDKVAIVTGAARGMGAAEASLFVAEGFHGFDLCGAPAGDVGGGDCGDGEDADDGEDDGQVGGFGVVEERCEASANAETGEAAER